MMVCFLDEKLRWLEKGERSTPHQGIDICYFLNDSGQIAKINSSIFIPALDTGIILTKVKDFLGTISQAKNKKVPPYLHISVGIVKIDILTN